MITNFKIFENTETETTFILNDLIAYYNGNNSKIKKFITELLIPDTNIRFESKYCIDNIGKILVEDKYNNGIISKINQCSIGYIGPTKQRRKDFVSLELILKK